MVVEFADAACECGDVEDGGGDGVVELGFVVVDGADFGWVWGGVGCWVEFLCGECAGDFVYDCGGVECEHLVVVGGDSVLSSVVVAGGGVWVGGVGGDGDLAGEGCWECAVDFWGCGGEYESDFAAYAVVCASVVAEFVGGGGDGGGDEVVAEAGVVL